MWVWRSTELCVYAYTVYGCHSWNFWRSFTIRTYAPPPPPPLIYCNWPKHISIAMYRLVHTVIGMEYIHMHIIQSWQLSSLCHIHYMNSRTFLQSISAYDVTRHGHVAFAFWESKKSDHQNPIWMIYNDSCVSKYDFKVNATQHTIYKVVQTHLTQYKTRITSD